MSIGFSYHMVRQQIGEQRSKAGILERFRDVPFYRAVARVCFCPSEGGTRVFNHVVNAQSPCCCCVKLVLSCTVESSIGVSERVV